MSVASLPPRLSRCGSFVPLLASKFVVLGVGLLVRRICAGYLMGTAISGDPTCFVIRYAFARRG